MEELLPLLAPGGFGALVAIMWPHISRFVKERQAGAISEAELAHKERQAIAEREQQLREELQERLDKMQERLDAVEDAERECQEDRIALRGEISTLRLDVTRLQDSIRQGDSGGSEGRHAG